MGDLITCDKKNAEVLNAGFASVFTSRTSLQQFQVPETRREGWRKEGAPFMEKDLVREYFSKLDIHKSIGPNGTHPQGLRELTDVIVRSPSIIFDQSWQLGEKLKN